jgi:hypothetical protein
MHARSRLAALLAVAALFALLPLRGGHAGPEAGPGGPSASIAASSAADDAPSSSAPLHDEGSCSICRALRDARALAPPSLATSHAAAPASTRWTAERHPLAPRAAFLSGAAPRAPPLA